MIPKIIHYCWFGKKPLPKTAINCIDSWKKFFPGYEIKEWNEDNFDVNMISYTAEAYAAKKYAFVSDYARFWILYHYGGIYFDTDVEVIKPMDDILTKGPYLGCEEDTKGQKIPSVNPGLGMAAPPKNQLIKEMLDNYAPLHFLSENEEAEKGLYKTVVSYLTDLLEEKGLKPISGIQLIDGFYIYPKEYFNPLSYINQLEITSKTYSIHHYAATWAPIHIKLYRAFVKMIGPKIYGSYIHFRNRLLKR